MGQKHVKTSKYSSTKENSFLFHLNSIEDAAGYREARHARGHQTRPRKRGEGRVSYGERADVLSRDLEKEDWLDLQGAKSI